ncbi:hypothetical protein Uis1B_2111 [Bifidobacterium margollesii]|uniref:Toxin HicA n=1 Tax=Bifidobacterium margollesii TaxID=2020964 RepID=A0A2N5J778_9BIFI|nr:hypothetical protein [Bifidobacterium margollesii]PLS30060.1 hypothetical protein Uis1B_2111 [Bifidobacterium margollesii]
MTKRKDIIKRIRAEARKQGIDFTQAARKGGNHDIYLLDGLMIPPPRHNEIPEPTTRGIYRECEDKLGKDWWK